MAFLRTIRNTLFGQTNTTQAETAQMLGSKLAKNSKLTTSTNDLPLDNDPLAFKYFTYPNDLNTISNGHYVKFDIYENKLSKVVKQPTFEGRYDSKGIAANVSDVVSADTLKQLARYDDTKVEGDKGEHVADNSEDGGVKKSTSFRQDIAYGMNLEKQRLEKAKLRRDMKVKTPNAVNMDLHSHTHQPVSNSSIILYTQSTNTFGTTATYDNAETGVLADFIGDSNIFDSIAQAVGKIGGGAVVAALEIVVPGAGGFFNRSTGMAVNPNMELAFKSVPFRSFNFDYKFAPKNKKELDSVHKIIQLFRFHMSPALMGQTSYFSSPSQFVLTYMYRENNNNYIPKIAKCVLENMEVDYSPGDKFTTLKPDEIGASPQLINVKMQFKEMSIITKQSISEGY
tara:strand:+ start:390 stop:1583 length:1194 start_codon:yes stop_codon:yes gene_type:complete